MPHPTLLEEVRVTLLADLAMFETRPVPERKERWAVRPGYEGIEHAQVVVAKHSTRE
ncbi:MAG: hypothetical protein ACRD2X_19440 [Vicinamibacteraceae bacterium]